MDTCENAEYCTFFEKKLMDSPSMVEFMKVTYCENDFEHCARYMLRQKLVEGYYLPDDDAAIGKIEVFYDSLFPTDRKRAKDAIDRMVQ